MRRPCADHLHHVSAILRLDGNPKQPVANPRAADSPPVMVRPGFLDSESRRDLIDLARDGAAAVVLPPQRVVSGHSKTP